MARYLIVANQTLGGAVLQRAVADRLTPGGAHEVYVVVPTIPPEQEAAAWTFGYSAADDLTAARSQSGFQNDTRRREARFQARFAAQQRAQRRLDQMLVEIRSAGARAEGCVGDPDPLLAIKPVLQEHQFDEILISTLPSGLSRWLRSRLPRRVARLTGAVVTVVEAEPATDTD